MCMYRLPDQSKPKISTGQYIENKKIVNYYRFTLSLTMTTVKYMIEPGSMLNVKPGKGRYCRVHQLRLNQIQCSSPIMHLEPGSISIIGPGSMFRYVWLNFVNLEPQT